MEPPRSSVPIDVLLEIVLRCSSAATVVRCAATCKLLRRNMTDPSFLRRLGCSYCFDPCLLAGHFHFEKKLLHPFDPFFVASPLSKSNPAVSRAAAIHSFMSTLSRKISVYEPLASRGGVLALRRIGYNRGGTLGGEVFVCNPTRGFGRLLPVAEITGDSYILSPCEDDGGRSFRLIAVKFLGNLVRTQSFTSPCDALSPRRPLDGRWGELAEAAIVGPKPKVARQNLQPVFLRHMAYWLCKASGKYHVLSLHVGTMQASYIALPPECSSTSAFNRSEVLLQVPALSSPEARLGLLTLGSEVLTIWTLAAGDVWTRRTTISRARIADSAGVIWPPSPMQLECCGERSGTVLLKFPGSVNTIVLSLQTMEAKRQFLDRMDPSVVFPYEMMDVVACVAAMKQF